MELQVINEVTSVKITNPSQVMDLGLHRIKVTTTPEDKAYLVKYKYSSNDIENLTISHNRFGRYD